MMAAAIACGCGSKQADKPATGSGSAIATTPPPAPADAAPTGLGPKIKAARCGEPCLMLTDTPFDKLLDTYKAECGGMQTKDPGFSDCKKLHYLRRCIYAAHGTVDKKGTYKKTFGDKPWYEPHPEFEPTTISELERANVHELYERGKACKKGLHVSGADYDRIKAWFAALPKVPPGMPKYVYVVGEPRDAKDFVPYVVGQLDPEHEQKTYKLDSSFSAEYQDDYPFFLDDFSTAMEATKAKTRTIAVAHNAEFAIFFVYDDKDQLVGINAAYLEEED